MKKLLLCLSLLVSGSVWAEKMITNGNHTYPVGWGSSFINVDLKDVDPQGKDWRGCDLSKQDLSGKNLSNIDLKWADLGGANLDNTRSELVWSTKEERSAAKKEGEIIPFAKTQGGYFVLGNMQGVSMKNAKHTHANFEGIMLADSDCSGTNFAYSTFTPSVDGGVPTNFKNAKLKNTVFYKARCSKANFENADATGAYFIGADLAGVNFKNTVLKGADLRGAVLGYDYVGSGKASNEKIRTNLGVAKLGWTTRVDYDVVKNGREYGLSAWQRLKLAPMASKTVKPMKVKKAAFKAFDQFSN